MYDLVRQSARKVTDKARFIRINRARLEEFTAKLQVEDILKRYTYEDAFHFLEQSGSPEKQLEYVFTVDAINFGSGYSPLWRERFGRQKSLYMTIADGLKRHLEIGGSLNADFAANVTPAILAEIFDITPDFPLTRMFAESLNQLGGWLVANYAGSYSNLIKSLNPTTSAAHLIELLAQNLSYFDDRAVYEGETIYFLKRAQILVNDLYLAFGGIGYGYFPDISDLTMFADNLVPHVFRIEGALEYESRLLERINKGEFIPAGSPEEIEIRASGLKCVEELTSLLGGGLYPAQVDVYLWNLGQDHKYKKYPRHLTRTFFY
jgi:hypothetical protein